MARVSPTFTMSATLCCDIGIPQERMKPGKFYVKTPTDTSSQEHIAEEYVKFLLQTSNPSVISVETKSKTLKYLKP